MPLKAIRCTYPACSCDSFSPSKSQLRLCQGCKHGWVAHALDKLAASGPYNFGPQVEPVSANVAFDVASLMLYGSQAVPIRLKILLDRLFSILPHDEVLQVLHGFGWSHEDYARGYILVDSAGRMLDKWTVINKDEEYIVVQQFLRFAETRTLAQEIVLQETRSNQECARLPPRTESDIKKFIERNNLAIMQSYNLTVRRAFESQQPITSQLFAGLPGFAPSHLASLHAAAAAAAAAAAFPPSAGIAHAAAAPILLGLKQESCTAAAAAAESVSSPKAGGGGSIITLPAAAGGRVRAAEPFDLRAKSPESSAARSPPASSHSSPGSSLASAAAAAIGSVAAAAGSFALSAQGVVPAGLKVDTYGLPPSAVAVRPDFTSSYMEEGAINLSKDAPPFSSRHVGSACAAAVASPKPHGSSMSGSVGGSRHRQHHHQPLASPGAAAPPPPPLATRAMSVGGGWPYGASFGSAVFVGASGKKRVLCTACNKTFCDKGALKIHYSAVHLKEMHRCTIPGCTMMFSSRRSRNRHSANPNPKLHTPQTPRRPRERLLEGGGPLSSGHHHLHRALGGGSSGNLSQTPSAPNSDDDDSFGGGGGGSGRRGLDDDDIMDMTAPAEDDEDDGIDDDEDEGGAYYAAGDSTQGSSGDGQLQLHAAAMTAGVLDGSGRLPPDDGDDDAGVDDADEYDRRRCRGDDGDDDGELSAAGRSPRSARRQAIVRAAATPPPPQQLLRSNKRKCLMPTRVTSAVSAEAFHSETDERSNGRRERHCGTAPASSGGGGGDELDSPSTDSCSSFAGRHQDRARIVKPEPTETPPSDVETCEPRLQPRQGCSDMAAAKAGVGERLDRGVLGVPLPPRFHLGDFDAKQQQQQSALQALFSSFLPRGGDPASAAAAAAAAYWPSKLHSMAAAIADGAREPGECGDGGRGQRCSDSDSDCSADSAKEAASVGAGDASAVDPTPPLPHSACQCPACSKLFQNQFYMRVHYQNVHLKSMAQSCLANGRSATAGALPSRVGRLVGGLNLHRKSSEHGSPGAALSAEHIADARGASAASAVLPHLRPDGAARARAAAACGSFLDVGGEDGGGADVGPSAGSRDERKVNGSASTAMTLKGGNSSEQSGGPLEPPSAAAVVGATACCSALTGPAEMETSSGPGRHPGQGEKCMPIAAAAAGSSSHSTTAASTEGAVVQQPVAV